MGSRDCISQEWKYLIAEVAHKRFALGSERGEKISSEGLRKRSSNVSIPALFESERSNIYRHSIAVLFIERRI